MTRAHGVRVALLSGLMVGALTTAGQAQDVELKDAAANIVGQLEQAGQKSATVIDFTDLQGQGNELGRYLAQELSDRLVTVAKTVSFVDRSNVEILLRENKLSVEGLISPESRKKLGNLIGIDTIIVGTITPTGRFTRLSVRAIGTDTGKIIASHSVTLQLSDALNALYTRGVAKTADAELNPKGNSGSAPADSLENRFRSDSLRVEGRVVRFSRWMDGTQTCFNGDRCATVSLVLQNLSGVGFTATIKTGSTSIGNCVGNEEDVSGLSLDRLPSGITFYRADRVGAGTFVAPAAKIPITIKVRNCPQMSASTVDVSLTLNVTANGQSVQIPVGASNVPVK